MKEHGKRSWWRRLGSLLFGCGGCGGCGSCGKDGDCGASPCGGDACACRHREKTCRSGRCSGKHCGEPGATGTLADLAVGQSGRVIEVADGDQDLINRFADHGLVRGIRVTVHEQALFGGPMLVAVQGTMVALRLREARLIRVKVCREGDDTPSFDPDISWKQTPHPDEP